VSVALLLCLHSCLHANGVSNEHSLVQIMQLRAAGEKHGVDLTKKKPIIKATAIRYCQEHAEAQEDDAAEEEEKADEEKDKAEVAVEGDVIAPVEEVYLHDDCHSNLRSIILGSCTSLHTGKLPSIEWLICRVLRQTRRHLWPRSWTHSLR